MGRYKSDNKVVFNFGWSALFVFLVLLPISVNAKVYEWTVAQSWGKDFVYYSAAVDKFIDRVQAMSQGRIKLKKSSREDHEKPQGMFEAVRDGEFEIANTAASWWGEFDQNTLLVTSLPFGMTSMEQYTWFYYGGGFDLAQKVYSKHGLMYFPGGVTGNQMGGWFGKEISTLDDLKGLKLRIPGLPGRVYEAFGVEVTNLPPNELSSALESGKIDAVEWGGPAFDITMGYHKVAPYYYTGWHDPAAENAWLINREAFNSLPEDLQDVLEVAMKVSAFEVMMELNNAHTLKLDLMLKEYPDIKIRAFPSSILREFRGKYIEIIEEMAGKDSLAKEILESIRNYRQKVRLWTRVSDQAFLNNTAF
ncbi:MAG: TRAP transporter substrate-binding protein [Arenicella sp.]